jgi:ketosteroid isomerase-like protein
MKRLVSLIPLALLLAGATPAQPPSTIAALTQTVIDAANANNPAKLAAIYTDDAVVVDENPPFAWRGATAGTRWWAGVQRALVKEHLELHVTASPPSDFMTDREGDDAYVTQRLIISVTAGGKTADEHGTQTYTFHKGDDGDWKISRQIWTTTPPVPPGTNAAGLDGPARQMMDAFNEHSPDALAGLYSDDATFIDNLSPLVWDGSRAGAKWYAKAMKYLAANGIAGIHGVVGTPIESRLESDTAYVTLPVRWSGTANGKPFVQHGFYTMTLRNVDGRWLITSQTWLAET